VLNSRKTLIAIVSGLACFLSIGLVAPSPAGAEPDIEEVTKTVDGLLHEAERAQERYNEARVELKALNAELAALRGDRRAQQADVDALRAQVARSIVDRFQGSTISTVGQVAVSDNPDEFLEELATLSTYRGIQRQAYGDYATALEALDLREDATQDRTAEVLKIEQQLAAEKKTVDKKYAEAKAILDELRAKERALVLGGALEVPSDVPASGRAAAAVGFAMAQIGDPYVYGAAGPGSWDCSGLTMMAWRAAGVGLPHSSRSQFGSGARVSSAALKPGDLVFYYSPISHVGMYIGNGLIVHAPHPGSSVRVAGLYSMPFTGAVRPG
jgi:peptidoglycan DL-endopeptidase CwlO